MHIILEVYVEYFEYERFFMEQNWIFYKQMLK